MYPVILICGEAGSGKDTVAAMLADYLEGVCVAQADPMKRFVQEVFRFTPNQLWGPSEMRNAPDNRFKEAAQRAAILERFAKPFTDQWLSDVFPDATEVQHRLAYSKLSVWVQNMVESAFNDGYLTPRKVLQTLGTEWGREFSKDMWIDYALRVADKLLIGGYIYTAHEGLLKDEAPGAGTVIITDGRFRNEILGVKRVGGKIVKIYSGSDNIVNEAEKAGVIGHKSETEQRQIPSWFFDVKFLNNKSLGLDVCKKAVSTLALRLFEQESVVTL